MVMLKIFLSLFILGFVLLILLVAGETHAMENTYPRFTIWWRNNVIGIKK